MAVSYDGKKILPCPLITIEKEYNRSDDDCTKLCASYIVTLRNSICVRGGSPTESGTFWTASGNPPDTPSYTQDKALKYALIKREAIEGLFAEDGLWLEIQPYDNSQVTKFRPRVRSVRFNESNDLWVDSVPYEIVLETNEISGPLFPNSPDDFDYCVESASEEWQLEPNEEANSPVLTNTFRLTHNVQAKGKCDYPLDGSDHAPPWTHARDFVLSRAGIDYTFVTQSGAFDIPNFYRGYSHIRSTSTDELGGTYSLSENWIVSSGDALESFNVEVRESVQDPVTAVTINGEVKGLETRGTGPSGTDAYWSITRHKYTAASSYFQNVVEPLIYTRAQLYSGKTLNPAHLTKVISRNIMGGVITYNFDYDTRPTNCVSGAKFESIQINDGFPTDIVAKHNIICRGRGTLFQDAETTTHYSRSVNASVIMEPGSGCTALAILSGATRPNWTELITLLRPTVSTVYKNEHNEGWNPKTGEGSLSISWEWPQ